MSDQSKWSYIGTVWHRTLGPSGQLAVASSLLAPLFYALALLRKLEQVRGIPFETEYGRAVMVSDAPEVEAVGIILKEYELVAEAKTNADKSVVLR